MNLSTKVMMSIDDDTVNKIGNEMIERFDNYIYLGHKFELGLDHRIGEVKRRIGLGCAAFGRFRLIFKSKTNYRLNRN